MPERTANEIRAARRAARSHIQYEGPLATCEAIVAAEDAARGLPRAGKPRGPGPHEDQTWDGQGNPPAGWTVSSAVPELKPGTAGVYAVPVRTRAVRRRLVEAGLVRESNLRERVRSEWEPEAEEE